MAGKPKNAKVIDWELIEAEWRAGIKSTLQMGRDHGISHTAIIKHFKRLNVPRDLTHKIQERAAAIVSAAAVSGKVSTETKIADVDIIEVNAIVQANALIAHRQDIRRYSKLAQTMLSELEATTEDRELFENLGELLRSENEKGVDRLNDIYQKVIATPGRVDSIKKLSEVLKTLIGLERQALGIADNANGDANKPPPEAPQMTDHEAARRVAFMLLRSSKEKP